MEKKKRKQNMKIVDFCSNWGILPDNIALMIEDDEDAYYEGIVEFPYEDNREEWNRSAFSPQNPFSNAIYKGGNRIRLMLAAYLNQYDDPRWATFKQISDAGYKVKKGAHGITCEKWSFYKEQTVKDEHGKVVKDPAGNPMKEIVELEHPICRSFTVFHASQIEGLPEMAMETTWEKTDLSALADQLIAASECPIYERNQGRAYYSVTKDEIILPPRTVFKDEESFVKTMLHEEAHSTGSPTRLNREIGNSFGDEKYAKEELVAELGALFAESDLGITLQAEHYEDHSDYLRSWISALKDDYSVFFAAVADAEKAADRIVGRYRAIAPVISPSAISAEESSPTENKKEIQEVRKKTI